MLRFLICCAHSLFLDSTTMDYISNLVKEANEFIEKNDAIVVEKRIIEWLSILMILSAFIVAAGLFVLKFRISYGRYSQESLLRNVSF